jgi:hypothetical protein
MRYFKIIIVVLSIYYTSIVNAQITFNITTSFGVDAVGNILESDSGYYSAITSGQPILPRHSILCFYDTVGNLKWNKVLGDSNEYFNDYSMYQDSLGNFTMGAGYYKTNLNYKFGLRRTTITGDSIWFKYYGTDSTLAYIGAWVLKTKDDGYLISGSKGDTADGNIYVVKTDSDGNFEWDYELLGNKYDQAYDAAETSNHDYLIVGWTRSFGNGNLSYRDAIVVCIDSLGNYKWKKTFGVSNLTEIFFRIKNTIDGNFIICGGYGNQNGVGNGGIWKINPNGNILWSHYYQTNSNASILYGINEIPIGHIIAVGSDRNSTNLKDQGWILELDGSGNKISDRRFVIGSDHCIFNDVKQTKDNGFMIAGYVFGGPYGEDGWFVKLDSNLCDSVGCGIVYTSINEIASTKDVQFAIVYPNPCTNILFIKPNFGYSLFNVIVYDITGKEIQVQSYRNRENIQIVTETLSPGIYLAKFQTDIGYKTIKFLKN